MRGIDAVGFTACTPIQEKVAADRAGRQGRRRPGADRHRQDGRLSDHRLHPPAQASRDASEGPRALIIAPTRELVVQILHDARASASSPGSRSTPCTAASTTPSSARSLRDGVDVLIGTPGRLIDYFKQRVYTLQHVEVLVIDEADRMFDMGFIADLRFLLRRLPPYDKRQSMLFSATLNWDVMELAYEHMNDPVEGRGRAGAGDGRERRARPLPRRPPREAAAAARPAAAREAGAHADLRQHQARGRVAGAAPRRTTATTPRRSPATCTSACACASCASSRPASCRSWSPPTSPRAACTSRTSRTSSTTTCRRMPRTTSTASAARRAPARRARRSRWPARPT